LNSLRDDLNSVRDELNGKIDALVSNFDRLRLDVRGDIRGVERQIGVLNNHLLKMQTDQTIIEDRLDQLESKVN
jgi:hypothetical protein